MTREEIDIMWQQALQDSVRDGEMFTRYHFAKMVEERTAARERDGLVRIIEANILDEREACAKVCDELDSNSYPYVVVFPNKCAEAIRARGES